MRLKRIGKIIMISLYFVGGVICLKASIKLVQRGVAYKTNMDLRLSNLYEMYTINNSVVRFDTAKLDVICLGNSITIHAPRKGDLPGADSLWRGNWGMCASKPEYDYVHRIESEIKKVNSQSTVTTKSLWVWENDFNVNKDSLLYDCCRDKNLIILKIGENIKSKKEPLFNTAFEDLVSYLLRFTHNIIIVGNYWPRPSLDQVMISVAREHQLPYVPLSWIYEKYRNDVIAHVGDTIFDTQMKPYTITSKFICTHPNDKGMEMISEAILNVISIKNGNY